MGNVDKTDFLVAAEGSDLILRSRIERFKLR